MDLCAVTKDKEIKENGYINENVHPQYVHTCVFKKDYLTGIKKCIICGKNK